MHTNVHQVLYEGVVAYILYMRACVREKIERAFSKGCLFYFLSWYISWWRLLTYIYTSDENVKKKMTIKKKFFFVLSYHHHCWRLNLCYNTNRYWQGAKNSNISVYIFKDHRSMLYEWVLIFEKKKLSWQSRVLE